MLVLKKKKITGLDSKSWIPKSQVYTYHWVTNKTQLTS